MDGGRVNLNVGGQGKDGSHFGNVRHTAAAPDPPLGAPCEVLA